MTDFRPVPWADDEDITAEKLNQMSQNDQYLLEHSIPMSYNFLGLAKTSGLKIAAGVVFMNGSPGPEITQSVYFPPGFFTQGSRPVVTATLATYSPFRKFFVLRGLTDQSESPDNSGFRVTLTSDPVDPKSTPYNPHSSNIHWMAMGY